MALPPGPAHLLRLLPYFALPSATLYAFLRISEIFFAVTLPLWFIAPATLLAKPGLFFLTRYYRKLRDRWDATVNEAILPPYVQESVLSAISKLADSIRTGYPADVMQEWADKYGNVTQFDILTKSSVITFEPEHVKASRVFANFQAILATKFESFEKGSIFKSQMNSLLGTGVFNVDGLFYVNTAIPVDIDLSFCYLGEMWKFHRSITRPFFTRERISDFEIYERNCDRSLGEARIRLEEGYSIDFQDLVSRFTLDSATEFLFGTTVGSLSAGIPYPPLSGAENPASFYDHPSNVFVKAFTEGQVRTAIRYSLGSDWPLGDDFWKDRVSPMRKVMDEFTEPLMREALLFREKRLFEGEGKKEGEEAALLEHLVNHTQDPSILRDELINLLVAGRDTTMCLLTFSFYMLAENPHIEKRLRDEIFEKVGQTGNPTYDQMREMKYMRAFLNEVLRLYPPVPLNMRASKEPVILPNSDRTKKPFYIPAGTQCFYPVINIHRRTDLWGPDALTFDPDRFLDVRLHKYLTPNPYIFCPFNAGPRICLGQQFAYHEATFYLVRLLQRFTAFRLDAGANEAPPDEWKACAGLKGTEKVRVMSHLTMYIKGGLWVTMKERSANDLDSELMQ
ncbi:cytochrome P450 [Pholiota conissans]|uniref:Cytochrome P450 n=1 Tax=Pholiota conissans TaxID=109636 RepID=A0A9P6CM56_9AGAR|nr:cytochrome P450 [Pholiota conissans]